jgi:hypothetical protein
VRGTISSTSSTSSMGSAGGQRCRQQLHFSWWSWRRRGTCSRQWQHTEQQQGMEDGGGARHGWVMRLVVLS